MPLHDWSRVDAGMFHHFHNSWVYKLADRLNAGVLPSSFFAAGEQYTADDVPDVLTLTHSPDRPDGEWSGTGAIALADRPPQVQIQQEAGEARLLRQQDRIVVREVHGAKVVAVIEIVSRGNKSSRRRLDRFVEKACRLLEDRIHMLILDVFPPGRLDPQGMHAAIWEEATGETAVSLKPDQCLAASYCAGSRWTAYVEALLPGQALPEMPLFLDDEFYVPAPLEQSYVDAWEHYPSPWKGIIESVRTPPP